MKDVVGQEVTEGSFIIYATKTEAPSLQYREAEIHVNIANAAARLADALGDKSFSITRQAHNW